MRVRLPSWTAGIFRLSYSGRPVELELRPGGRVEVVAGDATPEHNHGVLPSRASSEGSIGGSTGAASLPSGRAGREGEKRNP